MCYIDVQLLDKQIFHTVIWSIGNTWEGIVHALSILRQQQQDDGPEYGQVLQWNSFVCDQLTEDAGCWDISWWFYANEIDGWNLFISFPQVLHLVLCMQRLLNNCCFEIEKLAQLRRLLCSLFECSDCGECGLWLKLAWDHKRTSQHVIKTLKTALALIRISLNESSYLRLFLISSWFFSWTLPYSGWMWTGDASNYFTEVNFINFSLIAVTSDYEHH